MNGIGKINYGRALRQADNVTARSKNEDLLRSNIRLDRLDDILHILGFLLRFQQLSDPGKTLIQRILALHADLILPVGSHAVFRRVVHIPGTDLHLERNALLIQDGGVQRLVHILLGGGNIVLEPVWYWTQHIMDDAKDIVAFQHGIHNDAHRVYVVNLIKRASLDIHFAVDAVNAFYPPVNLRGDMLFLQACLDPLDNVAEKRFPVLFAQGQLLLDLVIGHRIKMLQGEILQLLLDAADPEPMSQGRIDLHGFQ